MKYSKGFTLIEVIITIVIMAIAATAFMTYFGSTFTGSAKQAGLVQKQYALIQKMEEITSQYRSLADAGTLTTNWDTFKTSCTGNCKCTATRNVGTSYTTVMEHLQVTCADGDQNVFAIFTQ